MLKVRVKDKVYDANVSIKDKDKVETYIKDIESFKAKIKHIAILLSVLAIIFTIMLHITLHLSFNIALLVYCFILIPFVVLSATIVTTQYKYFESMQAFESAMKFDKWISCISLDDDLTITDCGYFTISGIEKDTDILSEFYSSHVEVMYYKKDNIKSEGYSYEENNELKYKFRLLLPLELYNNNLV